ncbi:hypothetical protein [Bythopirellula goksoeyrii]|uniref:Autotransporter-associated beta strand repeat protein n=1 Tax=Bythopirellula goksoeyrii TaxID=1400387 RepID=A0A5B9Q7D2_9BACT|nr:hypothetical protein [Bythopirellula goksoeyrii]QEG33579.1 hypothetical protein Pr1d_08430 [Bythopirellula goksoeyrii]
MNQIICLLRSFFQIALISALIGAIDFSHAAQVTTPFVGENFESFEGIVPGGSVHDYGSNWLAFSSPYTFSSGATFTYPAFGPNSNYLGDWAFHDSATFQSMHWNASQVPDGSAWFGVSGQSAMEFTFDSPMTRVGVNPLTTGNFRISAFDSSNNLIETHSYGQTPGVVQSSPPNASTGSWKTFFAGIRANGIKRVRFEAGGGFALDGLTFDNSRTVLLTESSVATWNTPSDWEHGLVPIASDDVVVSSASGNLSLQGPNAPISVLSLTLSAQPGASAQLGLQSSGSITTSATRGVLLQKGAEIAGPGEIIGDFVGEQGSTIFATPGQLKLGRTTYSGFRTAGQIILVDGAILQLNSLSLASLGSSTQMFGGTLSASNGVSLGSGNAIHGRGTVAARLSAQNGSTIAATGGLSLGDSNSPAGFYSDGELHTSDNTVTINDSNDAVLGSLTSLGDGTNGGTLVAGTAVSTDTAPHFLVEQGKNVIGRGNIVGNFKNNGHVVGDGDSSVSERIVFDSPWIVSGIGTFANTLVNGTFSPGLSPAVVEGENFAFAGKVQMELGGTTPGSGSQSHDQIIDLETMELLSGVDLELKPWNGFQPQVGDTFELLRSSQSLLGAFDDVLIDPYFQSLGIGFDLEYSPNSLSVVAVSAGLSGDFDADGDVDGRDFLAWQRDPSVGDLADWQANYGAESSLENIAAIPEPAGGLLLAVATLTAFVRQRPVQV